MAKGQVRGNRETKKPKQAKKLAGPVAAGGFVVPKSTAAVPTAKKKV